MKKKQSLGFTLVEILVVISIIAVLSIIVIPLISGYLKSGKDNYNKNLESELVLAGENFFVQNKDKLPRGTSYSAFVTLAELESSNLVSGDFLDSEHGKCTENSFVRVIRDFYTNEYKYYGCLDCENYKSISKYCDVNDLSHDYKLSCDITTNPTDEWSNNFSITMKAESNFDIKSVSYFGNTIPVNANTFSRMIHVNKGNSNFIKNNKFDFVVYGGASIERCSATLNLDTTDPKCTLEDVGNGKASVTCTDEGGSECSDSNPKTVSIVNGKATATVYDDAGNYDTCSHEFDTTGPDCIVTKSPSSKWSKTNVTITGTCSDDENGCKTATVSRVIEKEGSGFYTPGEVCDNADNCTPCPLIAVNIDKTKPRCSTTKTPANAWSNENVVVTGTCSDEGSGCKESTVAKTIKSEGSASYSPGKVYDNAGNEKSCSSILVQIDKTDPTCTSTVSTSSWTNKNVTLTGTCSDKGGSMCEKSKVSKTIKKEGSAKYSPGKVCDNANNCTTCSKKTVKIDKTGPTCAGAKRNGNYSDGKVKYKYTFEDNLSGVKYERHGHCYGKASHILSAHECASQKPEDRMPTGSNYNKTFSPAKTKVTQNYGYNYGTGTIYILFEIKDAAGNVTTCLNDKTPYKHSYSHSW